MNNTTNVIIDISKFIATELGDKRKDPIVTWTLTCFYATIFTTGIGGNLCTFYVVYRNSYMKTVTNYYLLSLAVADLLILFLGKYRKKLIKCGIIILI